MTVATDRQHHRSERLTWLMIIFLVGLGVLAGGMVFIYLRPQPQWLNLGPLTDFPPQDEPYLIDAESIFYLVHTPDQLAVLKPETPHPSNQRYLWQADHQRFEDPLTGSRFKLDGTYFCGPAERNLDQYAYKITDGELSVSLSTVRPGASVAEPKAGPYDCLRE
jgi:hypothetical protein